MFFDVIAEGWAYGSQLILICLQSNTMESVTKVFNETVEDIK